MTSDVRRTVGENIRRLAKARGMTLLALSKAAGVGEATVYRIANGRAEPGVEMLAKLAGALDVDLPQLVEVHLPRIDTSTQVAKMRSGDENKMIASTTTKPRTKSPTTKAKKGATAKPGKVPVNERALLARVNRKLAADAAQTATGEGVTVVRLRGHAAEQMGRFVLVPTPNFADVVGHGAAGPISRVERAFDDLEAYAREVGVLRSWEELVTR